MAGTQRVSMPGESERDFRIRLQQSGRERRDEQVERPKEIWSNFERIDGIRRAKAALAEQEASIEGHRGTAWVNPRFLPRRVHRCAKGLLA
jgi:hypothetical protein